MISPGSFRCEWVKLHVFLSFSQREMKYLILPGTVFIVKKYNSMFFSHFNKGKQLFRLPIPICFPGQKNSSKMGSTLKRKNLLLGKPIS